MRHKYLARDHGTRLFDALASGWWTTGGSPYPSTYYVDLGAADVDEKDPGYIGVMLTGLTSGGAATIALSLFDCDTAGGSYIACTPVGVGTTAIAFDHATWADAIYLPLPDFGVRQFIKLNAVIAGANLTAGVIDAWFAKRAQ